MKKMRVKRARFEGINEDMDMDTDESKSGTAI